MRAGRRKPGDPALDALRLLLLGLWPLTVIQVLPGQSAPGTGQLLAWLLLGLYSVAAVLFLAAGARPDRVLLPVLLLLTAAGVVGGPTGQMPGSALIVPVFLGTLTVLAALRLERGPTLVQAGAACVGSVVCLSYDAVSLLQLVVVSIAVCLATVVPALAVLSLRGQLDAARAQAERVASTDLLTGVLNRRGVLQAVPSLLAAAPDGSTASVVALDLDDFKQLNDTQGHAAGDAALREIGAALQASAPEDALVARVGGEEFLVVAVGADTTALASLLRSVVAEAGATWGTTASVGAVTAPSPEPSQQAADWLLEHADSADALMYRAKREGGDRSVVGTARPGAAVRVARATPAGSAADGGAGRAPSVPEVP